MTTALLASLITRLARDAGASADHDEILRRVEDLGPSSDPRVAFESAAGAAGLRVSRVSASLQGLRDKIRALPTIAPASHAGERGFVVVVAVRGRGAALRYDVIDVDGEVLSLGASELAHRLGVAPDVAIEWLLVEPALPLAPAGDAHHPTPHQRLRALMRMERTDLAVVVVYGAVVGVLSLATPLAVQALVSAVAFGNLLQPLIVLALVVVLTLLTGGALRALQLYVVEILQRRLFVRLVSDLAWRLPRVPFSRRDDVDGSKIVNRFFDVLTVQKASSTLLLDGVVLTLEIVTGLTLLAFYSDTLMAFALALFFAVGVIVFGLGRNGVKTSMDESMAKHDIAGWLEDLVRHPTAFRTTAARDLGLARADALTREYLTARARHFSVLLRQSLSAFGLQAVASAALLGVGGALVIAGDLTLGQLVAAELIVGTVTASLAKIGKQLENAYDLFAAIDKIGHLVDLDVERDDGGAVRERGPLGFAFFDVVAAHIRVLGTFSVEQGAAVSILGASGAGKSLLVDVLLGLRDPVLGRVSVDGDDVRVLSPPRLRARVGLARDGEIFEGTVAENLRIGRRGVSPRALVEALRIVELDDVVLGHPDGLGRMLIPGSGALSSGEARRLMIARALLGDPGIVILDGILDALPLDQATRIVGRLSKQDATLVVLTARADIAALLPRRLRLLQDGVVDDVHAARRKEDR